MISFGENVGVRNYPAGAPHFQESQQSARMVQVTVAQNDCRNLPQILLKTQGVTDEAQALARIEKNVLLTGFHKGGEPVLSEKARAMDRVLT
jgi:hypothetical protein